jgi:site-specific recombinase XerD
MRGPVPSLGAFVQRFFGDYLAAQRALSPHTMLSYRDGVKLFLLFAARRCRKSVADLGFADLGADTALAFLDDLERSRGNSVRTRNVRLAALHTFFRYVADHEPEVLGTCQRICAIPVKKTRSPPTVYLEHDEVLHLLDSIDRTTHLGRRDHLLIRLLFETGARAHEVAALRTSAICFSRPHQVHLLGKGRKERVCPLRSTTTHLIRKHLDERSVAPDEDVPLFLGRRGEPLTRHGVLRVVQRRATSAGRTMPSIAAKRIGAHTMRHSAAVHLLRSGNALPVIRSWLGHVSVVTTDRYTEIDTEMKRRALAATDPIPTRRRPSWKRKPDLLTWLEAL